MKALWLSLRALLEVYVWCGRQESLPNVLSSTKILLPLEFLTHYATWYWLVSMALPTQPRKRKPRNISLLSLTPSKALGYVWEISISSPMRMNHPTKKSGKSSTPNYLKELMLKFGAINLGFIGSSLGQKVNGEIQQSKEGLIEVYPAFHGN